MSERVFARANSHRRRLSAIGTIAAVLPLIAWHAASAGSTDGAGAVPVAPAVEPAAVVAAPVAADSVMCAPVMTTTTDAASTTPDSTMTTTTPGGCAVPTTAPETTVPPTAEPTVPPTVETTVPPTVETTVPPTAETTVPPTSTETTMPPTAETTVPPTSTETTAPPTIESTVPSATTAPPPTTVTPDTGPTTTSEAVTTVPPTSTEASPPTTVPEDPTSAPPEPAFVAPSGQVIIPAGAVDTGQLRSITFPVAGPVSYGNDWGACRDGCRRAHKGIDLIGDRLQPLLAMHDGTVDHLVDHPTAGFGVAIVDDEGWRYDIYHMNNDAPGTDDGADDGTWRFADGIVAGARVTAGQVIGWMGDSGNSEGSVPHAHVEIHLPGGTAINPYWSLRQAQRDVNCAVAEIDDGAVADPQWLAAGWREAILPGTWQPLALTGGGGRDVVAARMWIGDQGYIPVDAGALFVGDPRHDEGVDCTLPPAPVLVGSSIPAELSVVLATIRAMETGGNYTTTITSSSASGAYAFINAAWGGYGGYARAYQAPPAVQDQKAAEFAASILARNGGDVSMVPVVWYIGHVPVGAEWDTVPSVGANILTPREYQARWLGMYARLVGADIIPTSAPMPWTATKPVVCRTAVVDVGGPGAPQYVLTRTSSFAADADGVAVVAPATTTTMTTLAPGATSTTSTTMSTTTVPGADTSTTTTTTIPMITVAADGVTPVDPCDPTRPQVPAPPGPPIDNAVTVAVRPRPVRVQVTDMGI